MMSISPNTAPGGPSPRLRHLVRPRMSGLEQQAFAECVRQLSHDFDHVKIMGTSQMKCWGWLFLTGETESILICGRSLEEFLRQNIRYLGEKN